MELDELVELAGQQARIVLLEAKQSELLTSWILEDQAGRVSVIGTPWQSDVEKESARLYMRRYMRQHGTVRYSFLCEAWQAYEKPGEYRPEDPDWVRPRDRADRIEVVIAMACDKENTRSRSWKIVRNDLEQIIALEPLEEIGEGPVEGWVTSMLK